MNTDSGEKALLPLFGRVLLLLVFALSFRQAPLYTSNQNTYFLHGLARAGSGLLHLDWLSQTADPVPVFSALVSATAQHFDEKLFYLIYIALLIVFGFSILGIARRITGMGATSTRYLACSALLVLWYSSLLASFLSKLPLARRFAYLFDPGGHLTSGVAEQYVLGSMLQPSVFGVFLVLSIYLFLRGLPVAAVVCLSVAATFHPAYLLSAGVLTGTYMVVLVVEEKSYRRALSLGTVSLLLVIPILAYTLLTFRPTTPEIFSQAQSILVDFRMPHHSKVAAWFGRSALLKAAVIALGLYLARGTRLFLVLLLPLVAAVALTLAQLLTGSNGLALLFPWRVSVFLVPIASFLILAKVVAVAAPALGRGMPRFVKPTRVAITMVVVGVGCFGIVRTIELMESPRHGVSASTRFVAASARPGDLYLAPPELGWFRLATGVPTLADRKSHPYRDGEVVEWFDRVERATGFYAASPDATCSLLAGIVGDYRVNHVYAKSDWKIADCDLLLELYRDSHFAVFSVQQSR